MWLYLPPKKWTQIRVLFSNCSALDVPSAVAPEFLLVFPGFISAHRGMGLLSALGHANRRCAWESGQGSEPLEMPARTAPLSPKYPILPRTSPQPHLLPCALTGRFVSTMSLPAYSPRGLEGRRRNDDRIYV